MWQTFLLILDYLEHTGKIHVEKDRTITWLWDPAGVERVRREGVTTS